MERLPRSWLILVLGLLALPASCASSQPVVKADDGRGLEVVGVLKNRDGSPGAGQVVYVAAVVDGRISTSFRLERGTTTGLDNPHSRTDANGRFRILVEPAFFAGQGPEFTVGILDCARCFTFPRRRLVRGGLPLTFRLGSTLTGRLDLGEIRLE